MAEIDALFSNLVETGGSDLHLTEGEYPKTRVHGAVSVIPDTELLTHDRIHRLLKEICDPKAWEIYMETGDLDFAYSMDEKSRFRCNYLKQRNGLSAVFRLIPTEIASLEDLNIPAVIKQFGHMRSGLVLVTGPTGSGKSTTLAALIDYINSNFNRHIVTIEEPIEFVHRNKKSIITQREVPIQTPSFADGLRAVLREDADIVLVGEMRDLETISLALTAAETGLLVFGTLHTNNARKTVDRIVDVFPADQQSQVRTMLAASLRGVVAQLLMKRCDKPGRAAVNEIMFANTAVSAIIREGATQKLYDVIIGGKAEGMQFMDEAIWDKLQSGMVTPQEAYMKAIDKTRFKKFLPQDLAHLGDASGDSPLEH
ncbi:PilT/PilU family type 4a pilus ATPase [Verrucomicrobiaceae bacterium R5-34]|uniref:PilT/PilU family type 4a pilus ATPase n=1 Tax=Oceaniferula flava TaxID=2800421 RepID=A0AAE2SCW1_9BACT|nr:PilT/PilU family type 4a pilus ATPase [Oceaniferula flavus]MBK1831758.1 PilT/PilU family type 4a pilus ATPase [Verrucomicrobiaceae bacterium R5-34]MBK1856083.1 PilT/PilU family type 4a pilus ATPase [Oceaniferula flavus]MBM1137390.1 PilT/PilU family type 4a pilus ATPase [Oceaniferula flavus]